MKSKMEIGLKESKAITTHLMATFWFVKISHNYCSSKSLLVLPSSPTLLIATLTIFQEMSTLSIHQQIFTPSILQEIFTLSILQEKTWNNQEIKNNRKCPKTRSCSYYYTRDWSWKTQASHLAFFEQSFCSHESIEEYVLACLFLLLYDRAFSVTKLHNTAFKSAIWSVWEAGASRSCAPGTVCVSFCASRSLRWSGCFECVAKAIFATAAVLQFLVAQNAKRCSRSVDFPYPKREGSFEYILLLQPFPSPLVFQPSIHNLYRCAFIQCVHFDC